MTLLRLAIAGLLYHRRVNAAVALGVIAGTAVLTGALVVGDSVRGSLRNLTLERLGAIDEALVTERFFRAELAAELAANAEFKQRFNDAVPAILFSGNLSAPQSGRRASGVSVLGCDGRFWRQGTTRPEKLPSDGEIVLNAPLAAELQVTAGDEVLLRLPRPPEIPPDSPLGKTTETIRSVRLTIVDVIAAEGLGRFGLLPNQQLPHNAYVAFDTLQELLERPGQINAIFAAGSNSAEGIAASESELNSILRPTMADYGLKIERVERGDQAYFNITSDRMLLDDASEAALLRAFASHDPQPVMTYLATTIAAGEKEIPYSTIAAIDFGVEPPSGPFVSTSGETIQPLAAGEIALNRWAAEDLDAELGDTVRVSYFEPESTHGEVREKTQEFRLAAVVEMSGPAVDPALTPELPGVTDQLEIGDWNPPFPYDGGRIRQIDEDYWDKYRATPKAFVSLAAGRRLWGSRFGRTTSLRIAATDDITINSWQAQFQPAPPELGFEFLPVKRLGLAASAGATPFEWLFLGFSLFIIAAAVMLVVLLFRLGIDRRTTEIGALVAGGWRMARVRRLLLIEGLFVSTIGAAAGVVIGVGYAWLMLAGLRTWWLAAVSTPFLRLHPTPESLIGGGLAGVLISLAAVVFAIRQLHHASPRQLLAGKSELPGAGTQNIPRRSRWVFWGAVTAAAVAAAAATQTTGEAQAGAFFGGGALVLVALLTWFWTRLRAGATRSIATVGGWPLVPLAMRNGARHSGRSTLTVGLVAAASFLIVAISAFRLDPAQEVNRKDGGSGGFELVAQSDQPIYHNPGDEDGRFELGLAPDEELLADSDILSLRVRPGEDASCLNLYQPRQPRVLGLTDRFIQRGGFAWASSLAEQPGEVDNPWLLLKEKLPPAADGRTVVPVVMDANTATYSLHKKLGDELTLDDDHGQTIQVRIVGLLKNSIFQGDLLMAEAPFLAHFPYTSGYAFFLVDQRPSDGRPADRANFVSGIRDEQIQKRFREALGQPNADEAFAALLVDYPPQHRRWRELLLSKTESALETALGDFGFDAQRSADRLAGFMAVQNTYLSTFQSLGGLGLLLGTFGLAAVQLRNVLERRGELALLRAVGFRRALLALLVLLENAFLLIAGLAVGLLAALAAVLPHWLSGGATVPWISLSVTLAVVLAVGLLAGLTAVRACLTTPLLPALRSE